jgi:hypothetical protein
MTELTDKTIELDKFTATVLEPGLIENHIKPGMNMEPRDAWELKKINRDLSEGRDYVVLITSGHLSSVSKDAREVVASKEFAGHTIAKAILVESLGHRIVGNFYLSVNKPFIRTRIFTDRNDALRWLKGQLNS